MSYNIVSAQNYKVENNCKYFLDANIWINILAPPNNPPHRIKQYLKLFDEILSNQNIKVVVPALLISEVINRVIKNVYFISFASKNGLGVKNIPSDYYKNVFRPSNDYIDSYKILADEFIAYSGNIELINDGLGNELNYAEVLENPSRYLDFNDNYYYQLAVKRNYKVITDDKDFWVENLTVITQNNTLLEKQNKINIEKAKKQ